MDDVVKKSLHDILTAIEEVESFFGDKPKLFEEFCGNICLKRAIERNIEIIGEAMSRIPLRCLRLNMVWDAQTGYSVEMMPLHTEQRLCTL